MIYKAYYIEEQYTVIFLKENTLLTDEDSEKKSLNINIKDKSVEHIYDFFKKITVEAILMETGEISLDYSEIEKEKFYIEESFQKLKGLLNELIELSNKTIISVTEVKQ